MTTIRAAILFFLLGYYPAWGYINLGNGVYQSDGSDLDTQAAVNAASDGNSVIIPNGTYSWANQVSIAGKSIILAGQSKGGVTINHNYYNPTSNFNSLLYIRPSLNTGNNIEVKNLVFQEGSALSGAGHNGTYFIQSERIVTYPYSVCPNVSLVHDCAFHSLGDISRAILWVDNGGVIWNCTFDGNKSDDGGISFKRPNLDTFMTPSTMGTLDTTGTSNTYVEDCQFSNLGIPDGCTDVDDGGRAVFRHCTFTNTLFCTHGQETSGYGLRFFECYNNTFEVTDLTLNIPCFFGIRGATFVIHDNTIGALQNNNLPIVLIVQGLRRSPTTVNCPTQYPVARQIGQGWSGGPGSYSYPQLPSDGTGYITDPAYIWGNTNQGIVDWDYQPDQCGNNLTTAQFVQSGRDYFVGTPKPGYTAYPYPHPLRTNVAGATPLPPQNLRVVQ
jgi:hypothetical protein